MVEISDNLLSALGINGNEAKVYLAALELGEATMQGLAKKSGVNRSTIYTFIETLESRGFILEWQKSKRRIYSAVHPDALIDMQRQKIEELENILPELLAINNKSDKKPRVTFYEGFNGVEDVYKDMLREKKEIVAYEDLESLKNEIPRRMFEWFPKERAKKDVLIKAISRDTEFAREFSKGNRGLLRETKFISTPALKTDINVYGDKVALIDLQSDSPFGVVIENKNIAETMRAVWNELWNKLGPAVD